MIDKAIALYTIIDDLLKRIGHKYGVRIHMITTSDGIPVEFVFMPGGMTSMLFTFFPCSCHLEVRSWQIKPITIMRLRMVCG